MGDRPGVLTSLVHEPLEALGRLLGRRRRGISVGLALSGGAARGIAHIGVLAVLYEAGIVPDMVAGTSAGAVAGAFFCRGWSPEQMLHLVRGITLLQLGRPSFRRPGLLDGTRFEDLLRSLVGDLAFSDLSIPLAVIACNLLDGQRVIIREGPLAPAVRASCSIPGIFTPVEIDDQVLVDGGLVDHLPVSVLRDLGMDYVIGVDVHPREVRCARPRSFFDTLAASYQVMICKSGTDPNEQADCLIHPSTECFDWLRFSSQADDLYQVGREAAAAALPQLQRDLEH